MKTCGGHTLIEVLISSSIGLVLILGSTQFFTNTQKLLALYETQNLIQENNLYAINEIATDLRMAGYWGINSDIKSIVRDTSGDVHCRHTNVSDWALNTDFPVSHSNNTYDLPCKAEGDPAGHADTLTLRHASSSTSEPENDYVQLLTDYRRGYLHQLSNPDESGLQSPRNYRVIVHSYFIATDTPSGLPELRRWALAKNAQFRNELVIDGISNLQVRFATPTQYPEDPHWSDQYSAGANQALIVVTGSAKLGNDLISKQLSRTVTLKNSDNNYVLKAPGAEPPR